MSDSLRSKTICGLLWSLVDWVGVKGVNFVIGIILARLLLPEQFGLIGMLAIFMAVAQSFLDSGFGSALIQRQETTQVDYCSIFYFNIGVGLAGAVTICLAAPWIAVFYSEPLLTPLARVLSLNIIINSFGLIQTTLMVKRVDFKTQAKISTLAAILSGTIGVGLAMRGFGVWSLVAQSLSSNGFRTLLLWVFNSWRPSLQFSFASLRRLFAFGSRMLASGLLNTVFDNIYLLIIGRVYSSGDLGYYTRAKAIQDLPPNGMLAIGRVTFPVFATVQDDAARLKRGVRKVLCATMLLDFPVMIGLAMVARPLVSILLTDKWEPCVPYLHLLCIVGLMIPLHAVNVNILVAKGRTDLLFRLEILKKLLVAASIAIAYRWNIEGIIWSQIVVSMIAYGLNSYYAGVLIAYPAREQIRDFIPYLAVAMVMGTGMYLIQCIPFANNWALIISETVAGASIYIALSAGLRLPAFMEILEIVRDRLRSAAPRITRKYD